MNNVKLLHQQGYSMIPSGRIKNGGNGKAPLVE